MSSPATVHDDILAIVDELVATPRTRGLLSTRLGALGQCSAVTYELIERLAGQGIAAQPIRFKGHRGAVPFPDPEGDGREEHLAVLVHGVVIDLTRRQFDPHAEVPTTYAAPHAAAVHWRSYFADDRLDELWSLSIASAGRVGW